MNDTSGNLENTKSAQFVNPSGDRYSLDDLVKARDYTRPLGETPEQQRMNAVARVLDYDEGIQTRLDRSIDPKTQLPTLSASHAETRLLKGKYPELNLTFQDLDIYFRSWRPRNSRNETKH